MSSPKAAAALLGLAACLATAGCIRPLYGPTASGVPLKDALASIEVVPINTATAQERLAHNIRSELIFNLDGSGTIHEKKYRLTIDASEAVQATTTDTLTGRADTASISVTARFSLVSNDGGRNVLSGTARTTASYFRDPQRFASVRAARDAEIRASKQIADDIRQRLAAVLATSP